MLYCHLTLCCLDLLSLLSLASSLDGRRSVRRYTTNASGSYKFRYLQLKQRANLIQSIQVLTFYLLTGILSIQLCHYSFNYILIVSTINTMKEKIPHSWLYALFKEGLYPSSRLNFFSSGKLWYISRIVLCELMYAHTRLHFPNYTYRMSTWTCTGVRLFLFCGSKVGVHWSVTAALDAPGVELEALVTVVLTCASKAATLLLNADNSSLKAIISTDMSACIVANRSWTAVLICSRVSDGMSWPDDLSSIGSSCSS